MVDGIVQDTQVVMTNDPQIADQYYNMSIDDIDDPAFMQQKIPKKLKKYIDMDNIAEDFDENFLSKIAITVINSADADDKSREEWKKLMKYASDLIRQSEFKKDWPWDNASNVYYPLIISACIQFNARTMPEIIKNKRVVEIRNMNVNDKGHTVSNKSDRLSAHMTYQMLEQSTNWRSDTDKLCMSLPLIGTVYRKSYFDSIDGIPATQLCLPQDVIINNDVKSLEKAQRITHIIYMTTNEIIENMRAQLFLEYPIDDLCSYEEDNQSSITTAKDKNEIIEEGLHQLYEQHRFLDLDGDGYQEPYIVTVHVKSQKILRIVARYDESSFEYQKNRFVKINPIQYFTDYHLLPNPTGSFHSYGFGILLAPMNATVNSILNQLIDSGTLSNAQCGFISNKLRLPKGSLYFDPPEWKILDVPTGTSLSEHVYPLPTKEPSVTLFNLLTFIIDSTKNITSISDPMAGNFPPPNTPEGTVMAMIEEGQKVFSSILARIHESLKKEFKKLYNINKKYLKKEEQFPMAQSVGMISADDYNDANFGIFPVADPQVSSSYQRSAQAQSLLQLAQFPQINTEEVLRNYLETMRIDNPDQYIVKPDPNAPPPPSVRLEEAKIRNTEMDTACKLIDRELASWGHGIDEMKVISQSAFYGGRLATEKIDAITKLAETEQKTPPEDIKKAAIEEETLTKGTQLQDIPTEVLQKLMQLGSLPQESINRLQSLTGGGEQVPQQETESPHQLESAQNMLQENIEQSNVNPEELTQEE